MNNAMEKKRGIDEGDDCNNKRLRLHHPKRKNINPLNENENIEENGRDYENDSDPQHTVRFYDVQASTPISQNGIAKTADEVTNEIKAIFPATSPICETTLSSSGGSEYTNNKASPFINTNEQANNAENLKMNNVNILQDVSFEKKSSDEKSIEINTEEYDYTENTDVDVISHESKIDSNKSTDPEAPQLEEQKEVLCKNSWQYDSDNFLNSFLQVSSLKGHADNVNSVVVDGDIILSASSDTTIKLWDSTTKKEIRNFQGHTGEVTALILLTSKQSISLATKMNFPDDSRILISASLDCSIRLWSISSGVELLSFYTYNGITCLEYVDGSHLVVLGTDGGKLEIWDVLSSKVKHSIIAHQDAITCLKIDGCYAYTSSIDGLVKVWELEDEDDECSIIYTRRRMQRTKNHEKLEPTNWRCFEFLDNQIYLGDNTSYLKLLNWREGHIQELRSQVQLSNITDAVCIKEEILISSYFNVNSNSGGINVWRLPEMKYICTMSGKLGRILSLAMTITEDKILRVISGGTELLIWDFISDKPLSEEKDPKYFCRDLKSLEEKRNTGESSGSSVSLISTTEDDKKTKGKQWCALM